MDKGAAAAVASGLGCQARQWRLGWEAWQWRIGDLSDQSGSCGQLDVLTGNMLHSMCKCIDQELYKVDSPQYFEITKGIKIFNKVFAALTFGDHHDKHGFATNMDLCDLFRDRTSRSKNWLHAGRRTGFSQDC